MMNQGTFDDSAQVLAKKRQMKICIKAHQKSRSDSKNSLLGGKNDKITSISDKIGTSPKNNKKSKEYLLPSKSSQKTISVKPLS
jgi:hypothetical protein